MTKAGPSSSFENDKNACRENFFKSSIHLFPKATDQTTKNLFHYTSFSGFYGIISSRCLHASNFAYLNDASEIRYGRFLFSEVIRERNFLQPGRHSGIVDDIIRKMMSKVDLSFSHAYGCCFSDLYDSLSQWRGYGQGICIAFDRERLQQGCIPWSRLEKVIYRPDDAKKVISNLIDSFLDHLVASQSRTDFPQLCSSLIEHFQTTMELTLPTFKHPLFHSEQEWRLLEFRSVGHSPALEPIIEFRWKGDSPIPFLRFQPEGETLLPITSVIIGPSDRMREHMEFSAHCILEKYGYQGVPVYHSQIPFRPT